MIYIVVPDRQGRNCKCKSYNMKLGYVVTETIIKISRAAMLYGGGEFLQSRGNSEVKMRPCYVKV
jgi:hypothetical protein